MVGTRCIDVEDPSRQEDLGPKEGIRKFTIRFYYPGAEPETEAGAEPEAAAEAKTESPTVLYGYFGKTVTAKNEGLVTAAKNTAQVYAYEKTKVDSFVTASGPAGQESGVSGALYFKNRADAFASGFLRGGRQVAVNSRSEETLNTVETVRDAEEASGAAEDSCPV